jgi:hypothetical protein
MKLRGDWGSGCIVDHRYHTANLLRQLITGIQVPDNTSIVKAAFSSTLGGRLPLYPVKLLFPLQILYHHPNQRPPAELGV